MQEKAFSCIIAKCAGVCPPANYYVGVRLVVGLVLPLGAIGKVGVKSDVDPIPIKEAIPGVISVLTGRSICAAAKAEGYTLSEEGQKTLADEFTESSLFVLSGLDLSQGGVSLFLGGGQSGLFLLEESFAALAEEHSEDGRNSETKDLNAPGGLYESIFKGQMVSSFNDWIFEEGRKAGDVGLASR